MATTTPPAVRCSSPNTIGTGRAGSTSRPPRAARCVGRAAHRMPLWIVGAVVGVVLVGAGAWLLLRPGEKRPGSATPAGTAPPAAVPVPAGTRLVALLPFASTVLDRPDLAAFAAGLTALVRRHLFCVPTLSVLTAEDS